ncbi:adhesion G-protein coupled receptor G2-like [Labeo rohita]|uniref:adhesion G-protein coupled receptor G2-like n=1 Tax=Labeo rohita TaxID=84645 RepID=UPI0021E1F873|nr:adhesion G-protein coupled receptor G2-like [Labeo rohita]
MTTPESTTTSTLHTTTPEPTSTSTLHTTTTESTTTSTLHTTTPEATTTSTLHTRTPESTTSSTIHTRTPELTTNFKSYKTTQGYIDPSKASEALDNLESTMKEMEEKKNPNETVVIGHASGLLYVQAKNTETKDIYICYSSNQATIVESQTDLKANCSWSVKISKEAFDKSRLENNGSAFVGLLRFQNIENKDKTKNQIILNNEVYGITMRANIANLTNSIDMLFTNNDTESKASCSSWDGTGELVWTTFGCKTKISNNSIKCSCSHLTFFSVMMFPPDVNVTAPHPEASLTYVTHIGCGISIFFLTIALFMHFLLRKAISNQATKILMNMFVALCLLNVLFLSNESVANTKHNGACIFIALVLHYSMLASFTWFFIQALHMYLWLIRQNVTITNYMWKITVLGWVCPTPMVVVIVSTGGYGVVTLNVSSGTITQMCWITDFYIHYIVNIGYYILVFILVAIITVVHARNIIAIDGQRQTFRKQLMMVLSLFLLFGVTWFVAFISYGPMIIPSYYIFTVFNSFSGFFLFLYYYYIRNDVAGHFSDDAESIDSN